MKTVLGAVARTAVFGAAPASAAVDYLHAIQGINGESTHALRPGAIAVEAWSWGLSNNAFIVPGQPSNPKVSLKDFAWTQMPVDSTWPAPHPALKAPAAPSAAGSTR